MGFIERTKKEYREGGVLYVLREKLRKAIEKTVVFTLTLTLIFLLTPVVGFLNIFNSFSAREEGSRRMHFLPAGDRTVASARYRCYQVEEKLKDMGVETELHEISGKFQKGYLLRRVEMSLKLSFRAIWALLDLGEEDIVFFQKYAATRRGSYYVFMLSDWLTGADVVFDCDDAIFLENNRVYSLFEHSDIVIAGSEYIKEIAEEYNDSVHLVPTSVDTGKHQPVEEHDESEEKVIGWVGSPATLKYLSLLQEPLKELGRDYDIQFVVIGANDNYGKVPEFENIEVDIRDWELGKDWKQIEEFDVGVMPMWDGEWERGKCAFKAIQYMCKEVPAVVSPVGENKRLIEDGRNGFIAGSTEEWVAKLSELFENPELCQKLGKEGRQTIEEEYDTRKAAERIKSILFD